MMLKPVILATIILILHQAHAFTSIICSPNIKQRIISSIAGTSNDGVDNSDGDDKNSNKQQPASDDDKLRRKDTSPHDVLTDTDDTTIHPNSARVKRKKKNGYTRYRTNDNRDNLPFLVKVTTPDPYTTNDEMERTARKNTKRDRKRQDKIEDKTKNNGDNIKKKRNLIGMNGKDSISSSIYTRYDDGTLHQILGEFALDKSTSNGDIIETAGNEYQVQKSRCQYKYTGGRFVMMRKILEVKQIKRVLVEQEIREIFNMDMSGGDGGTLLPEDDDHPPVLE